MLLQLYREIDSRTHEIAASQIDWPCRRGCDGCCRRLAALPRLTGAEWRLVEVGLGRLPHHRLREVAARIWDLTPSDTHYICPFLDRETASCAIYEYRPAACRTYGFYVERDRGLYCGQIEERVESGEFAEVVWGNAAGVDARLDQLGEKIGILEWFSDSPEWSPRLLPTPASASPDPGGAR